jgi:hypothetical protein
MPLFAKFPNVFELIECPLIESSVEPNLEFINAEFIDPNGVSLSS